jgi:hypothetical protein
MIALYKEELKEIMKMFVPDSSINNQPYISFSTFLRMNLEER